MKSNLLISRVNFYSYFHKLIRLIILSLILGCINVIQSQPSGGPYGPVPQNYVLPSDAAHVYYVAPDGKAESTGKDINNPTSIESAFEKVTSGDAIVLRGGVYRTGNLLINQGITIQPYLDEHPILIGTKVATDWKKLTDNLWVTSWKTLFPSTPQDWWQRERNGFKTPMHRFNNDMVFADGRFLQSVGWEGDVDENSYFINYETGQVYVGNDPESHLIEITAYNVGIHRIINDLNGKKSDKKGPVIKGITLTKYAFRAIEIDGIEPEDISPESAHGKEVTDTKLENCEISYCSRVAAYLRGDRLQIRNCKIANTSTEGIFIIASSDVLLERNIFTRNNIENITGYFPSAVKIFNQCYRVTCNDNLVIDLHNSNGIWYDVGNVDGVFTNNWVENVGTTESIKRTDQLWPSDNGFFFEISKNAICTGNVFVNCDHGIMVLNSSNVKIYQNTFINSSACFGRDARSAVGDHFGWHPSTGPDVDKREGHVFLNNLMYGNEDYLRPLLFTWQNKKVCGQLVNSQLMQCDYNVFIKDSSNIPLIIWGPAANDTCQLTFKTLGEFQKSFPQFSAKSKSFSKNDVVFKSLYLGNYQVIKPFNGSNEAAPLPEDVVKRLKLQKGYKPNFGAYPY